MPNALTYLACIESQLTTLPLLPASLQTLYCSINHIICFPTFPNSITSIDLYNNPYNCLPNYIAAMGTDTVTYPLCATGNTNGCPIAETTGIKQIAIDNVQLKVYPNPTINMVHVAVSNEQVVEVYDMLGKEIISTKEKDIDVSALSEGVYLVQVKTVEGVLTKKIIIQR